MMQEDRSQHRNRAKAWPCCVRGSTIPAAEARGGAPPNAAARSEPATARNASAPTIFRKPALSDHRINLTLYKLPQIMEGKALGEMIDTLVAEHQAEQLAAEDA